MKKRLWPALLICTFLLALPALWTPIIFTDSSLIQDTTPWQHIPEKSPTLVQLVQSLKGGQLTSWVTDIAPVIHWHPDERYRASDPLTFFNSGKIYFREVYRWAPFATRKLDLLGDATPELMAALALHAPSTRLFERQGLLNGYAGYELHYDPELKTDSASAPLLWRVSDSPLFRDVQTQDRGQIFIPVEFWYHISYNPISIYFGSHDGDWESFLVVFDVRLNGENISATPLYFNTSSHGNSTWHCRDEITSHGGRWQLFSALDTHATYAAPGIYWRVYPDRTGDGLDPQHAWDTRQHLRPVTEEPYYGFSGSWGRTSFVNWMNGPIPPGPQFKYLPRSTDKQAAEDWKILTARCAQRAHHNSQ